MLIFRKKPRREIYLEAAIKKMNNGELGDWEKYFVSALEQFTAKQLKDLKKQTPKLYKKLKKIAGY